MSGDNVLIVLASIMCLIIGVLGGPAVKIFAFVIWLGFVYFVKGK